MKNQKLGLLALLLALLMSLSVLFVACGGEKDPGNETPPGTETPGGETGGSDLELEKIPTTEVRYMVMTLSVPGAVKVGETATLSASFTNAVAGTLTWSAAIGNDALTVTPASDTIAAGDESASAQVACSASGTVNVKATFVPEDSTVANIEKSASFSVAKKAVTLSLSQSSIAWDDDNKQAVTLTATLSGDTAGIASVSWESDNTSVATVSAATSTVSDNEASVTVTKGTKDGSATITATVSYNDGEQDTTAVATCAAVSSTWDSRLVGGLTFEETSGTTANFVDISDAGSFLAGKVQGITATYSENTNQTAEYKAGEQAFQVSAVSGFKAPKITLSFSGVEWSASEGISFSFWHKNAGTEDTPADWSVIAETAAVGSTAGKRVCFINLNYDISLANNGGGMWPAANGTLSNGGAWDSMITNTEWTFVTVVLNTDGVFFYENGAKICSYTNDNAKSMVDGFVAQIQNNGSITLFGNNECTQAFFVDNFILGKGMTDAQVATLYDWNK